MSVTAEITTAPEVELQVRPLQPTIGAEIGGIDLREPLSDAQRDEIKSILLQYKVVFFRDQQLGIKEHEAFASRFGPLYTHPSAKKADDASPIHRIAAMDVMD